MKRCLIPLLLLPLLSMAQAPYPKVRAEGEELLRAGKAKEAEALFSSFAEGAKKGLAKDDAIAQSAFALTKMGEIDAALAQTEKVSDPALAIYARMSVLEEARRYGELLSVAGEADFSQWPERLIFPAYMARGRARQMQRDLEGAEADYRAALKHTLSRDHQAAAWAAIAKVNPEDTETALAAYDAIIGLKPGRGALQRAHQEKALVLAQLGRYDDALAEAAIVAKHSDPYWIATALIVEGRIAEARNEPDKAAALYQRAKAVPKASAPVIEEAESLLQKLGHTAG